MTNDEYLQLIEKIPDLTAHGYGVQRDPHLGSTYSETFDNMRQELKQSYEAFLACVAWIHGHPDFERGWSSYALKHEVENWVEKVGKRLYIPQGAFIISALYTGLPLKRIPTDLGVFVG
jgi:hypothetical protein